MSASKRPPIEHDDDGGGKRPALAAGALASNDREDVCWLCLDAVHVSGQPLRRNCSCRGGSGFAHLPCIVEFAKDASQKNERAAWIKFSEAWTKCANCKQNYVDDLALELAAELISFLKSKYAGNRLWHLFALDLNLQRTTYQREKVKDICIKILSGIIEYMRETQPPVPKDIYQIEERAYSQLGELYLRAETKESATTAVEYHGKSLRLARAHLRPSDVTSAEVALARAKSQCEGRAFQVNKETLVRMKQVYNETVKRNGQESLAATVDGIKYFWCLMNRARGIEAERLLAKLAAICIRVHGSEHKTTTWVSQQLEICKERKVFTAHSRESNRSKFYVMKARGSYASCKGQLPRPEKSKMKG